MTPEKDVYVQRVTQLDGVELDDELHTLLREQVSKAFKYIKIASLQTEVLPLSFLILSFLLLPCQHRKPRYWSAIEPEFDALLRFIILAFSMKSSHATIGQQLLNIKYRDEDRPKVDPSNKKLLTFVLGLVAVHWIKSREDHFIISLKKWPAFQDCMRKGFHLAEVTVRSLMLINTMCFLFEGKYSLLLERLLRLKPIYASPQDIRQVSYEYLNRELLWHGFAEFFAFVMPILNVRRLINVMCRWVPLLHLQEPTMPSQRTRADYLQCAICEQSPTLPHDIGCSHIFCYYCITSNVNTDPNYRCPKCGLQVKLEDPIKVVTVR